VATVSGRVTLDGKPVANVSVVFQPRGKANSEAGVGSIGTTDAHGQYTLTTMTASPQPGAVVGLHTVQFAPAPNPGNAAAIDPSPAVLPPELQVLMHQTRTFEVKADGSNEANFDLKSK
jgi:hypothetical protein